MGMHFLAKNAICTYKNQLAVIISPLSYNKVLIQTLDNQRIEVSTSSLLSTKNKIIKLEITEKSTIKEVNEQLMSIYGEYQKIVEPTTEKIISDFERYKNNLLKNAQT